ncbi:MAG: peptide-methionine (S)-S-oxide reductase MsrA [Anaerolineaceae bacterium]|nr:peptide-methionine (S)-S-oxide reductase MsrA [Anaerolineaceae bacterium]
MTTPERVDTAVFGAGCFWCVEAVFEQLDGVLSVDAGYAGGRTANPSYADVCSGETGHAEVTRITYDPAVITFDELLGMFWQAHDPTTLNRQGADAGTQYRSVIFTLDERQDQVARQVMQEIDAAQLWERPLVTQIQDLEAFYMAEDYHQEYFRKNPYAGYCRAVVAPKVARFRQKYAHRLKS